MVGTMRTHSLVRAGVALTLITLAGQVRASSEFGNNIPNGTTLPPTCEYCHTQAPALNAFGTAVLEFVPAELDTMWAELCILDSDGDGVLNGEELGDPCCVFPGGTPQQGVASNPGNNAEAVETTCEDPGTGSSSSSATTATTGSAGNGTGTGTGSGTGTNDSAGAGPAKPAPVISQGACTVDAAPGQDDAGAWGWAALAAGVLAMIGARRSRR